MFSSREANLHRLVFIALLAVVGVLSLTASAHADKGHRRAATGLGQARALAVPNSCAALRAERARLARQARRTRHAALRRQVRRLRAASKRRCAPRTTVRGTPETLYWGATIGSHLTGTQAPWDMSAVEKFEAATQKSASLVQFFQPFAQCSGSSCSFYPFPTTPLENVRKHGAIPVLSWSSQSIPSSTNEPDFQLSDVIEGRHDSYIRSFAMAARDWGHPFFLRFNWEMNASWFPWGEGANGNQPGEFVASWRRVHDIFEEVGADNVTWVWCPFIDPNGSMTNLGSLYPGDEYVDWTGLDGYNWGTNPAAGRSWRSFDSLFARSYSEITNAIAPSKPLMIGEVGSSEHGGSKADWIADALARIPVDYPKVRALLWFDKYDDNMDWPIETSAAATAAFGQGIGPAHYLGASYADLGGDTIPVPPSS